MPFFTCLCGKEGWDAFWEEDDVIFALIGVLAAEPRF